MEDYTRGHRMPGDLRRNRLELPACPGCGTSEPQVAERGAAAVTLKCTSCGHTWAVETPKDRW